MQNVKVKMWDEDNEAHGHPEILHFEIYTVHFSLAWAEGRATI
jgi:hypothetical protein